MKKKISAVLAVLLLATFALAGCGSSQSSGDSVTQSAQVESPSLAGDWEEITLNDGDNTYNVSAFVFTEPVDNCVAFDLAVDVTMNANTSCKSWNVWARTGGTFRKVGTIYLEDGGGYSSSTIRLSNATRFDAVAITPTASGSYSWSLGLEVSNVQEGTSNSVSPYVESTSTESETGILDGTWEQIHISEGNMTYTASALILTTPIRGCTSFDVALEVEMYANTSCKDWTVWARIGGKFQKVGSIYLEDGGGYAEQTVSLSSAKSFDAITITPAAAGSYSYSIGFAVYNVVQ